MAKLYVYTFEGDRVKENVTDVIETEKQFRVETGCIAGLGISKFNKAMLGWTKNGCHRVYVSVEPNKKDAVNCFLNREKSLLSAAKEAVKLAEKYLEILEQEAKEVGL